MIWVEVLRRWQRPPGLPGSVMPFGLTHKGLRTTRLGRSLLAVTCLLLVAACAEVELVSHAEVLVATKVLPFWSTKTSALS